MQACKYSKKYKGERPPRCNGGEGCETCNAKYMSRIRAEMNRKFRHQEAEASKK